jgi:hypothetical protein
MKDLTKEQQLMVESLVAHFTNENGKKEEPYVLETDIDFSAPELGKQHSGYDFKCYDGYAVGENEVVEIIVTYPKMIDLTYSEVDACMDFRYGSDHMRYDYEIHFGDVMMLKSKLKSFRLL